MRRVAYHEALDQMTVDMCPDTLVVGAGIAGLTAALELAEAGHPVYLLRRQDHWGIWPQVDLTAPYLDSARDLLTERITRSAATAISRCCSTPACRNCRDTSGILRPPCGSRRGSGAGRPAREVQVGNVIVCTGYREFDAERITHYGYGKLPNVITSFDFEKMLRAGRIEGRDGKIPNMPPSFTAWAAAATSTTAIARGSAA